MKRLLASILILPMLVLPVQAETIRWVDFNVPYESMKYALDQDIATFEQEKHISWIDILALAACRGKVRSCFGEAGSFRFEKGQTAGTAAGRPVQIL